MGAITIKAITTNTPEGIPPLYQATPSFPALYQPTQSHPPCAIAAPPNPPIKVCEELEGIPSHQVSKFQIIAAINPARTTYKVISPVTVFDTVSATCNLNNQNASTLKKAAQNTAATGLNTCVLTTVAMEFAAS